MSILPDAIVYIWFLPLALHIVLPLLMLMVYLFGLLIYFMLFPKKLRQEKIVPIVLEGDLEKAL